MAAPAITVRVAPSGIALKNGFRSLKAFARDPNISFWEKQNKPPGLDGGDAIEVSTMHNVRWRTMAARELITLTESTTKAAYDPNLVNDILALINIEGAITDTFSDGSSLSYFGYLKSIEFDDLVPGVHPECTITVVPTNFDPVGKVEADPVLTSVSGT